MEKSSKSKLVRAHARKWPGVYYYTLSAVYNGKPDRCYYFTYKVGDKKIWKKVGKVSEGFGPEIASDYRAKTVLGLTEGGEVLTPKEEREDNASRDKIINDIAKTYFVVKKGSLKGVKTDMNRYDNHIASRYGSKRVGQITPIEIELYKKELLEKHSPGTVWNILELLRRLINYGFKTHQCPQLDFFIEMPKKDNEKVEYLTQDEAKRFLKVVREWPDRDVGRMLQVAYFTGMRRGEIFKLEERDLDFTMNIINIRDPKGGKSQSIGMSEMVKKIFLEQIAENHRRRPKATVKFIFPGKKDGMPRVECNAVDGVRTAAGLPKTFRPFHGLRHHFGVTLANSGKFSINEISEALTHKNLDFTKKRYAQFLPGTLSAIGNAAANLLDIQDEDTNQEA